MEPVSEIHSESGNESGNEFGKKKEDKDYEAGAVAFKQPECMVEINIAPPTENSKDPASPPPSPAKVKIKIETVSDLDAPQAFNIQKALYDQFLSLEKAKYVEKLPRIVVKVAEDDEVTVEAIVIVSFADTSDKLIHSGNFILEAVDTTTLMEVKKGISQILDIRYEDMSIACGRRFLSDCRSLDYYAIFDGVTLHLVVDSPDEIFKNVFKAFLNLGHNEATAALATRSFICEMSAKYHLDEGDNPALTEELIMIELGQYYVPNAYESDNSDSCDSTDEDDSVDENEYPPSVFHINELDLLLAQEQEMFAANNYQVIANLQDDYMNEADENSENAYLYNDEASNDSDCL